jgi:quercetin dioxygenase-like cupin family protein
MSLRLFASPLFLLAAFTLAAQSASDVEITAEPHHHLSLENPYVRVFKVEVASHDATLMHHHGHDYVFVTLGASEVSNEVEGKPPVTLKLQDGEVHFSPGNFAHIARNLAATPFRNVTIEFMHAAAARNSPPPAWGMNGDEERGLHVLHGGTQDIMFVKDGVRVSEIDLQPGGVLPLHHHAGPHLAVAITDLDMRSDKQDGSSQPVQMKAGDIQWVPGGGTHSVTNVGKSRARWVTLEFH